MNILYKVILTNNEDQNSINMANNSILIFDTEVEAIKHRIELLKTGINSQHWYIGK